MNTRGSFSFKTFKKIKRKGPQTTEYLRHGFLLESFMPGSLLTKRGEKKKHSREEKKRMFQFLSSLTSQNKKHQVV